MLDWLKKYGLSGYQDRSSDEREESEEEGGGGTGCEELQTSLDHNRSCYCQTRGQCYQLTPCRKCLLYPLESRAGKNWKCFANMLRFGLIYFWCLIFERIQSVRSVNFDSINMFLNKKVLDVGRLPRYKISKFILKFLSQLSGMKQKLFSRSFQSL